MSHMSVVLNIWDTLEQPQTVQWCASGKTSASEDTWASPNKGQITFIIFRKNDYTVLFDCLPDGQLITEQDS